MKASSMSSAVQKIRLPDEQSLSAAQLLDKPILRMIMAQEPLSDVLNMLCKSIERQHPGLLCSVLLLDGDGKTLRMGASPSLAMSFMKAIDGTEIGPSVGSCGTAAYLRQPVIVSDIETDPLWADYRGLARAHGLRACWSVPMLSHEDRVLGTFAIYYREPRSPDVQQLQLIERASHLAGIAIERDRVKAELHAAETRYRALVERLPAITYIAELGAQGRWHYVSPQIESILGFSQAEWTTEPVQWLSRIHSDDRETALAAERRVKETGEMYKAEYRMLARDGRVLWFRDEAVMLDTPDSRVPLMQGVLYDITEHKRLEQQFRQAQKMEAVGQLAGGVAHDFNNLLMLIQAHIERIQSKVTPDDAVYADALEIQKAVGRAASLTVQLLAFSRKQLHQPKVMDLEPVLVEVGRMLSRLLEENIQLRIDTAPALAKVKIDQGQIEQVMLNLALNARDAMPQGGTLTIATQNVTLEKSKSWTYGSVQAGNYVKLTITDTGCGMNADVQAHLFEPFFTTKPSDKGTGLGLSMVYGVVKQSGGSIIVSSEVGRGSSFEIYIPQVDGATIANPEAPFFVGMAKGTETILLVEDQSGIRDVLSDALQHAGYTLLQAADGEEALRIVKEYTNPIHLVITDLMMPNMGGRELASIVTQLRANTKVLYISGYAELVLPEAEISAPILQKPFSLTTLTVQVRNLLDAV
jgi:two-component system cell cycle sensor histidine kinase/response regulator CckA